MKKLIAIVFALALFAGTLASAQKPAPTHNGFWWKEKSNIYKEGFVSGYKTGLAHAATPKQQAELKGFGQTQLIEGLDAFYKDFKNQKIMVEDALTYVLDEIKGMPEDQLKAELQKMRQAAAASGGDEQ